MITLTLQRGNPYNATITFTDSSGDIYSLVGKTIFFTVKKATDNSSSDADAVIIKDITSHTNASGGITALELTAAQTDIILGDYKWDLRVYDDIPLVQLNTTSGICEVVEIVTKRTV